MINIVLYEPEIAKNTGNIIRTSVCTNSKLHLIRPYGFQLSAKDLKRAGMDYVKHIDIIEHDCFQDYSSMYDKEKMYFFTTKTDKNFSAISYPEDCHLIFGSESSGLPQKVFDLNPKNCVKIPMFDSEFARCLNLSNSVAVAVYEVLRQYLYKF